MEVTFKQGRYLAFQNYLATTWALYDALAKVAGILCCNDELSKNKQKPVKLVEDFLRGKNSVGGRMHDHLKGAYGWPISISYKIRNWLVHDGHSQDGVELFKYDAPANSTEFEMSDDAWDIISKKCNAESTQTRLRVFPNVKNDLAEGLAICHKETDEAIGFVLLWATGVAKLQASLLFPRDLSVSPMSSPAATTQ